MFFLPLELKRPGGKASVAMANLMLIVLNVLLYLVSPPWLVGRGTNVFSIVLYGFSHLGFWHLVLNMWALWVFGNPVNRRLGNGYYLIAYFGALLAIGLMAWIGVSGGLAGASGAIFAVIAIALILMPAAQLMVAYAAIFPFTIVLGLLKRPEYGIYWFFRGGTIAVRCLWCLLLIPLVQLVSLLVCGWNWTNFGHLLGLLCGVAIVLLLPQRISMGRMAAA